MILQCLFTFLAVGAFCVLFNVPKKLAAVGGLVGAVCWFGYLLALRAGWGLYAANFAAAVVVAVLSNLLALGLKQPATMFFVPGILPIVPGSSLYYAVYNFAIGNQSETHQYFVKAITISVIIALSIFFVDSLFRLSWFRPEKNEIEG